MKNRQGSTLVLVLMIFVVLSILATGTMGIMMSENKQSIYQKNKIQAYYIARSGAEATEAAIMEICRKYDEDIGIIKNDKNLSEEQKQQRISMLTSPKDKLEKNLPKDVTVDGIDLKPNESLKVILKKEDGFLVIESISIVDNKSEILEKIILIENNGTVETNPEFTRFPYTIFGANNLIIEEWKSPIITGRLGTNSKKMNIYGLLFETSKEQLVNGGHTKLKYDIVTNEQLKYEDHSYNKILNDGVEEENNINLEIVNFKIPNFNIPKLEDYYGNGKDFIQNIDNELINKSFNYKNFIVDWNKQLIIDTTNNDVIITTNKFENRGNIKKIGNNNLTIYTENIIINSKKTISIEADSGGSVKIYHVGNENSEVKINGDIDADLYIKTAKLLEIHYNTKVKGDIYHGGKSSSEVKINGDIGGDLYVERAQLLEIHYDSEINGSVYHGGKSFSEVKVNGDIVGDLYVEGAQLLQIHYVTENNSNPKVKGSVYHGGDSSSEVKVYGNIDGNLYVKKAQLLTIQYAAKIKGNIHHQGNSTSEIKINGIINGNCYFEDAKLFIGGKEGIINFGKSIYYNGTYMKIENHSKINGSIYAPNAEVKMDANTNIKGILVGGNIKINAYNCTIEGNYDYLPVIPELEKPSNKKSNMKSYYK